MNRIEWSAEVKKQLTLRGENMEDVAKALGVSHGYIRGLVCGSQKKQGGVNRVSEYLGIYPYQITKDD